MSKRVENHLARTATRDDVPVKLTIDMELLLRLLTVDALSNKTKRTTLLHGAIVLEIAE